MGSRGRARPEPRCFSRIDDEAVAEPLLRSIVLAICDLPRAQQVFLALTVGLDWSPVKISNHTDKSAEQVGHLLTLAEAAVARSIWSLGGESKGAPPKVLAPLVKSYLRWAGERLLSEGRVMWPSERRRADWDGARGCELDEYAFPLPEGPEWEVFIKDARTS
jgi:hypothetical protein